MEQTIKHLKDTQIAWSENGLEYRIDIIKELFELICSNKNIIANSITVDTNKPIGQSMAEIDFNLEVFDWYLNNVEKSIADKILFENKKQISKI